jgi:hypothetical protein
LTAHRREEIARQAGHARARKLNRTQRVELARNAALARWSRTPAISTALDAPIEVRRLLKTYDAAKLEWSKARDRYAIVREVLVRGDGAAKSWLALVLKRDEVRALVRRFRGAGCSEPERKKLRNELGLTAEDLPVRSYIGFQGRSSR